MRRKVSLVRFTTSIIVIGLFVIGFIIAYIAVSRSERYILLQSYDHMETIMDLISQGVKDSINEKINLLLILRDDIKRKDFHPSLVNMLLNNFDTILYVDKNGNIIKYWSRYEDIKPTNISHREYFIKTKETLKPYISNSFRNIAGNYAVAITVPIVEKNSFNGLIVGGILLNQPTLSYLLSSTNFHRSGTVRILDSKGVVLFSADPTEAGKVYDKFPLNGGYRSIRIENIDGKDYVIGIGTIPGTNWRVLATVEKRDILSYTYKNLRYILVLSIILILALLIVIITPLSKLTSSLNLLRKTAIDYVIGNPPRDLSISNFSEINDIISAFQEMRNIIKDREEKLKEEQAYLETLLLEMGEGVLVLDSDKKIKFANRRFLEMTGYSEGDIKNIYPLELFNPIDREDIKTAMEECLKKEECKVRINILSKDGKSIPVLTSIKVLKIDEEILEYLIVFSDLTEIEKREKELEDALEEIRTLNEELNKRSQQLEIALASLDMKLFEAERAKETAERLAITDPLTGLFNRRFLEEKLGNELIRAKAYNSYLSIVMADIDHFKRINDTYGHSVGDGVLKMLAVILKSNIRTEDIVARYGGEEFVILLHNASKYDAFRVSERIRLEVEETSFLEIGVPEKITVSFGISSFPEDGEEPIELIKKADQALYQAKSQGRNRVVTFTEPSASIHF
ncbi:MAG: diguanylate cyclase [bacterium]|nr:diguanylate cyclase [bacterium]